MRAFHFPFIDRAPAALGLTLAVLAGAGCVASTSPEGSAGEALALTRPVASTPPMGWNSWNAYGCAIDETLVKRQADAMIATGMRDVGYEYVNLDDCWMATSRDAAGNLRANPTTFPGGIAALADYVHARGLKLGIYSSPGPQTCVGRGILGAVQDKHPGSAGHEAEDARSFAAWGVDYLKYDRCTASKDEAEGKFALMRAALDAAGRPILYSINPDGASSAKPWSTYANMWRTTPDIDPTWKKGFAQGWWSVGIVDILDLNGPRAAEATPGHWNDPDMLEVGVSKAVLGGTASLSDEEGRAHFSMWAIMASPLIAGNDLTKMSPATQATLTNAEIIALDQDALGAQGTRLKTDGSRDVWARRLADGSVGVALLNRGSRAASIEVKWSDVGLGASRARARDLWAHADLGVIAGGYTAKVAPHGVVVLRVSVAP